MFDLSEMTRGHFNPFLVFTAIAITLAISITTSVIGIVAPLMFIAFGALSTFLVLVIKKPIMGMMTLLTYCSIVAFIERETSGVPFNYAVEALYLVIWMSIIFNTKRSDWRRLNTDTVILFSIWFLISVLQLLNPAGASPRGWLHEIRTSGLDSFILVSAGLLIIRTRSHLNVFFYIIISVSLLATLIGIKQEHLGLFPGEREFLMNSPTHLLWGKIRVFSMYGDAGQFGASQAHFSVICGTLAMGPFKTWKRIVFLLIAILSFYGMLISGTRGAFFALMPGIVLSVFLFGKFRILVLGIILAIVFVVGLKFTDIGSSNYHVYRLRSALNPEDASFNVRVQNQKILSKYMEDYPFGGGLGIVGYAGHKYNAGKLLSTIEPDSYWVKVWAMYGIAGFVFWFCMIMYTIGKCCGIASKIKDKKLKVKLIALTSGLAGVFVCSYGNEVINAFPSSIIVYLSIAFIMAGPELDRNGAFCDIKQI